MNLELTLALIDGLKGLICEQRVETAKIYWQPEIVEYVSSLLRADEEESERQRTKKETRLRGAVRREEP